MKPFGLSNLGLLPSSGPQKIPSYFVGPFPFSFANSARPPELRKLVKVKNQESPFRKGVEPSFVFVLLSLLLRKEKPVAGVTMYYVSNGMAPHLDFPLLKIFPPFNSLDPIRLDP